MFTATQFKDRDLLGELVTDWIAHHPEVVVVDLVVRQSSDRAFHCITISVFFKGALIVPFGRRATTRGEGR